MSNKSEAPKCLIERAAELAEFNPDDMSIEMLVGMLVSAKRWHQHKLKTGAKSMIDGWVELGLEQMELLEAGDE